MKLAFPMLRSLGARWLAVELIGLMLVIVAMGWAQQFYSREVIINEVTKGGLATANAIRALLDGKRHTNLPEVQDLLVHLRGGVTGIREIYVIDPQGMIVAHNNPNRIGALTNEAEALEAIASGRDLLKEHPAGVVPSESNFDWQPEHLQFALPIRGQYDPARRSAIIGAVVLDIDIASAGARIASGFQIMVATLVALLLVLAAAQFIALRAGFRRLIELGQAATTFGRGQYGLRIRIGKGPIEFQQLESAFNDMAERVQASDAELRVAKKSAEAAADAKSRFLANMSHEIRTPLTGIMGYSDLVLEDPSLSEQSRRQIKFVYSASNSLRAVIDDILDLSKIETGKVEIVPQAISIQEIVDHCVSMAAPMASMKELKLSKTFDNAIPPWLMGDGARIQQVILNLVNNAVKFTEQGSVELAVSLERRANDAAVVRFTIRDTGIGIARDMLPELFQRFRQADETITRRFGGTGLGLAISKALVTLMHGNIGVQSELGKGSTFWFELTLPVAARSPMETTMEAAPDAAGRALRILVVDDSEMNADLATTLIQRLGHVVDKVNSGKEAVHACKARRYDLVLMDIQMPEMDGMEATRKIRAFDQHNRTMAITAMTANVLPEQLTQYRAAGLTHHLAKPIDRDNLRAVLANVAAGEAPTMPTPPAPPTPVFDRAMFDGVRELLKPESLRRHLGGLSETLAGDWSGSGGREQLMQRAHKLITTAGQFGFMKLSKAAGDLETVILRDGDVEPALAAFNQARQLAMPIVLQLIGESCKAEPLAATALAAS